MKNILTLSMLCLGCNLAFAQAVEQNPFRKPEIGVNAPATAQAAPGVRPLPNVPAIGAARPTVATSEPADAGEALEQAQEKLSDLKEVKDLSKSIKVVALTEDSVTLRIGTGLDVNVQTISSGDEVLIEGRPYTLKLKGKTLYDKRMQLFLENRLAYESGLSRTPAAYAAQNGLIPGANGFPGQPGQQFGQQFGQQPGFNNQAPGAALGNTQQFNAQTPAPIIR